MSKKAKLWVTIGILVAVIVVAEGLVFKYMMPKRIIHLHGITPGEPTESVDYMAGP